MFYLEGIGGVKKTYLNNKTYNFFEKMTGLPVFIVFILILMIIVLKFWDKWKKWKEQLRFIASVVTILSILFAINAFNYEQNRIAKIESENQKALLYALRFEIETNIEISDYILNNSERFLETHEIPANRFSTITVTDVINRGDIGDIQFKIDLRKVYNRMENVNDVLDGISIFIPSSEEQYRIFEKLRKERVNIMIDRNKEINPLLYSLLSEINSQIQFVED